MSLAYQSYKTSIGFVKASLNIMQTPRIGNHYERSTPPLFSGALV